MKLLKLIVTNFKPYFGEDNEISLYDSTKGNRGVTLNIGPTGYGKTSISDAIMYCLFGENYASEWENMVNDLAIDVAKETRKKSVKMAVELEVEIDGDVCRFVRDGEFILSTGKREQDSILRITVDGKPVKDPLGFVDTNFPPVDLMDYFIFDADAMLELFEKNRDQTIKTTINKIVGVGTLDEMSKSLSQVEELYEEEIADIERKSPGVSKEVLGEELKKKNKKILEIEQLNEEVAKYERLKRNLIPKGRLGPNEIRLKEMIDKQQAAEEEIKRLDKELVENVELISRFHLLFLKDIIAKSITSLNKFDITRAEFDNAIGTLRSTLDGRYGGVVVQEKEVSLIRKGAKISAGKLDDADNLKLGEGTGIKARALQEFHSESSLADRTEKEFLSYKERFERAFNQLAGAKNLLRQRGETEKNKSLKDKIDRFQEYDKKIAETNSIINETKLVLEEIETKIRDLNKDRESTEQSSAEVKRKQRKIELVRRMRNTTEATKKAFLKDLLTKVNQNATEFFRGVVREDDPRLNSISVDSDYQFNVKDKSGNVLEPGTISKGNTQVALMAFFFGLSRYMENPLPYVMDDPLIRLDPGYDKRLISHLCKGGQQVIMHLIPGKEYTVESFSWLRPFINTQNWINRKKERNPSFGKLRSYSENMDATRFVEYNIDNL